ncbi:hypothetical protein BDW71DRAFT_185555 [Aspergillus fruticulosus]
MFVHPLTGLANAVEQTKASWGCTVFRTIYTPHSDAHFDKIIELLDLLTRDNVAPMKTAMALPRNETLTLAQSHQLVVHDDKAQFDGMSLDDVRAHYLRVR